MEIEDYLNDKEFKTRTQLVAETGLSDREVRSRISELKLHKPVIYNSQTAGYRLVKNYKNLTHEELVLEIIEVQHSLNDIKARIESLEPQARIYEEWLYKARRRI